MYSSIVDIVEDLAAAAVLVVGAKARRLAPVFSVAEIEAAIIAVEYGDPELREGSALYNIVCHHKFY
jgi:hypothetical protein